MKSINYTTPEMTAHIDYTTLDNLLQLRSWIDIEMSHFSTGKIRIESNKLKPDILIRDNYRCYKCMDSRTLEVHHIFNYGQYPQLDGVESNLVTLCINCHKELHRIHGHKTTLVSLEKFIKDEYIYRDDLLSHIIKENIPITGNAIRLFIEASSFIITKNKKDYVLVSDFYDEFEDWCVVNNFANTSKRIVTKSLEELGVIYTSQVRKVNGKSVRCITGITRTE